MAASFSKQKGKEDFIILSSSSSSDQEEDANESSETEADEDDGSEDEEGSPSDDGTESSSEYDDEEEEEGEEEEEEDDDDDDDTDTPEKKLTNEQVCSRVEDLLLRKRSLSTLKLEECKAYLRKHELRLSGTKATCIERILEHWRIKDGNGEKLYPRASFVINCTGDVCTGDIIMFKQRVYEKFDLVTRGGSGNVIGMRIIAGRVVKESYGAAKQQHTFTVEILWSKGVKALPPLFALLIKGRNLYRLKTFRQHWSNEAERSKVLAEKHRRGAAARRVRASAKARSASRGSKRQRISSTKSSPPKKQRKRGSEPATRKKIPQTSRTKVPPNENGIRENGIRKARPNGESNMKRVVTNTRHVEQSSSATLSNRTSTGYHGNGIHTQVALPPRIPPYDWHHDTRRELHSRNNIAANGGMPYLPNNTHHYPHHHYMPNYRGYHQPYGNPTPQFDPWSSSEFRGANVGTGEPFQRWRWP